MNPSAPTKKLACGDPAIQCAGWQSKRRRQIVRTPRMPRSILWLIVLFVGIDLLHGFAVVSAQMTPREQKVRADREKVVGEGFWIYNDLPKAFAESRATGKPVLVVLRCLPCEECVKLDDDVVDQDPVIRPLLEQFVCVRVVSTNGLDLSLFQFDTDQSFAVFMLRDEQTIYGRFGTRSHRTDWIGDVSLPGMAAALSGALQLHASWPASEPLVRGKMGKKPKVDRPEKFAALEGRYTDSLQYDGDVVRSCIHCHQIGDAIRDEIREVGSPMLDEVLFPYPHPKSVGLTLDPQTRSTVRAIDPSSAADRAGLRVGDQILQVAGQAILSMADVQWILHAAPASGAELPIIVERNSMPESLTLRLDPDWRRAGDIQWRASTWGLRRMATGGMRLQPITPDQRTAVGIPADGMALSVIGLGKFGPHAAAKNAGFEESDILLSVDGRTDLMDETDFIRFGVREKKPGQSSQITVLRKGKRLSLALPMQP